jgi:hypothetical protein
LELDPTADAVQFRYNGFKGVLLKVGQDDHEFQELRPTINILVSML